MFSLKAYKFSNRDANDVPDKSVFFHRENDLGSKFILVDNNISGGHSFQLLVISFKKAVCSKHVPPILVYIILALYRYA